MLNVYDGTLGESINTDKIIKSLNTYLINNNEPLNYEVKEDKARVVIITGKNEQEKDLPEFQHPIIFEDHKHRTTIAVDMRLYMRQNLDDMINVTDYLADKYNGKLQLNRLIFNKLILDNDDSFLLSINNKLNLLFGNIIGTIVTVMTYDKQLQEAVTVLAMIHYLTMDMEDSEITDKEDIIDALPDPYPRRLMNGDLTDIDDGILYNQDLIIPSRYITDLTHNIGALIDSKRARGITADMLVQALSRTFFAINAKELALAMTEHLPTYLAIVLSVINEGINNRSMIRKLLEGKKSLYKTKEIKKVLNTVIDDNLNLL